MMLGDGELKKNGYCFVKKQRRCKHIPVLDPQRDSFAEPTNLVQLSGEILVGVPRLEGSFAHRRKID